MILQSQPDSDRNNKVRSTQMKVVESVDFFYLAMPAVPTAKPSQPRCAGRAGLSRASTKRLGSGRVREALPAPPRLQAFVAPMSHMAPVGPVSASWCWAGNVGQPGRHPSHVGDRRLGNSMWICCRRPSDLVGHRDGNVGPAGSCAQKRRRTNSLGYPKAYPKLPYAPRCCSEGRLDEVTLARAAENREAGFRAAKFGWRLFGKSSLEGDVACISTPRAGSRIRWYLADRCRAGVRRGRRGSSAAARRDGAQLASPFEEPFRGSAYRAYGELRNRVKSVMNGRRRGGPQPLRQHAWPSISSTSARSTTSRSIVAVQVASGQPRRSRLTPSRAG